MNRFLRSSWPAAFAAALAVTACGDDPTDPGPPPPTNVAATAQGANAVRVTFATSGRANDQYIIHRATGAASTDFAAIDTVDSPATGSTVTFDDVGLQPNTTYRYRVATLRGTTPSAFSEIKDATTNAPGTGTVTLSGDIVADRTLTADNTYLIDGFVHVQNGVTLTIMPGTTIKGNYATQGSSLFILRGAKIRAVGTADAPIVFTSSQPVGQRAPGDWGGLVIVGNGQINRAGEVQVEGTGPLEPKTPGTNYGVLYSGGTSNTDDSGELRYVRVEFAGYAIASGNELNSFTFAAVGSGTKLSHLQAVAGLDDSFEWFGGAVDATNLVSYESGDDHFDMSEGYQGRLQFLIAYQDTVLTPTRASAGGASTDPQGIENDGCEPPGGATPCVNGHSATPLTIPLVANFTLVGVSSVNYAANNGGYGMVLRRGTGGYYVNGVVARWPRAGASIRDVATYSRAGSVANPDLNTTDLAMRNILFAQTPNVFEPSGTSTRYSFDLTANSLTHNTTATVAHVFTGIPDNATSATTGASFDWTPPAGSPAASGGLATFTGKIQTKATGASSTGHTFGATSYLGAAAPGGAKWWAGWTRYFYQ
jgi:hypothetical protein